MSTTSARDQRETIKCPCCGSLDASGEDCSECMHFPTETRAPASHDADSHETYEAATGRSCPTCAPYEND